MVQERAAPAAAVRERAISGRPRGSGQSRTGAAVGRLPDLPEEYYVENQRDRAEDKNPENDFLVRWHRPLLLETAYCLGDKIPPLLK